MLVFKQTKKKRVDPPQRNVFDPVLKQSKERPQDLQTQIDLQIAIILSGSNFKMPGLVRVRPGHGSTRRVDRVLSGRCTSQSFNKPEPVQLPGPGSTRRAGPGLITVSRILKHGPAVQVLIFSGKEK
jgi:hypothetical protein